LEQLVFLTLKEVTYDAPRCRWSWTDRWQLFAAWTCGDRAPAPAADTRASAPSASKAAERAMRDIQNLRVEREMSAI
jgi:hypothetical protein